MENKTIPIKAISREESAGYDRKTLDYIRNASAHGLYEIRGMGAKAALIKGGHASKATIDDVLVWEHGEDIFGFPRLKTRHTHGTGCTLATGIACGLAKGYPLSVAVAKAREYVQAAIASAPGLGKGHGPLNHMVQWQGRPVPGTMMKP